jgi:hypothetical protein
MDSGKPLEPWQYRVSIRDTPATCLKVETYFVEKTQSEDCRGDINTGFDCFDGREKNCNKRLWKSIQRIVSQFYLFCKNIKF